VADLPVTSRCLRVHALSACLTVRCIQLGRMIDDHTQSESQKQEAFMHMLGL